LGEGFPIAGDHLRLDVHSQTPQFHDPRREAHAPPFVEGLEWSELVAPQEP